MNRGLSIYLDSLRALAAFVVLASHLAYPRFSNGDLLWIRDYNLGSDAVMLFFVLSGFVIAYAADQKDRTAGRFLFNRFTRVYSVALPALVFTFAIDALGSHLYPHEYDGWWYGSSAPVIRFISAVTFTNELGFTHIRIGTNGPYWSLAYEVWYYVLFAALMFLHGARRWLTALLVAFIMGPKIFILGFSWVAGVATYHMTAKTPLMPKGTARTLFWVPVAAYAICQFADVPKALLAFEKAWLGADFVDTALGFSDEFLWNALIGLFVAAHLVGAATLLAGRTAFNPLFVSAVRWLAGGSFSLYILHYPLLQFVSGALPWARTTTFGQILLISLVTAGCYGFAAMFERTLSKQRAWLLDTVGRFTRDRPQAV